MLESLGCTEADVMIDESGREFVLMTFEANPREDGPPTATTKVYIDL